MGILLRAVFFCLLLPLPALAAPVSYDLFFHANGSASLKLEMAETGPYSYFRWPIPAGFSVVRVDDASGRLDYSFINGSVSFPVAVVGRDVISIFFFSGNVSTCDGPVCLASVGLAGYDEATAVRVRFEDAAFFSSSPKPLQQDGQSATIEGNGSLYLRASYILPSAEAQEFPHYVVYAPENVSSVMLVAERVFPLISETTGVRPSCKRYIVSVSANLPSFATGTYNGACLIRVKPGFFREPSLPLPFAFADSRSVAATAILHETVHAVMEDLPGGDAAWFGEGVSELVALKAADSLKGLDESRAYRVEKNTSRIVSGDTIVEQTVVAVNVANRISLRELEGFYSGGGEWSPSWSPDDAQSGPERSFAYSYSHFVLNAFVKRFGADALKNVLSGLERAGGGGDGAEKDSAKVVRAMQSVVGANVSEQDLLYPYRQVFLAKGHAAFKEAVGPLAVDREDMEAEQEKLLRQPKALQLPALPSFATATPAPSANVEPWAVAVVLLFFFGVPLLALYGVYLVVKRIFSR